jgi:putative MATE family efflux protein
MKKERKMKMKESSESKHSTLVEGSVFGALIRFALPVLGASILQAAYGAVDLLVIGRFGDASSISAVGTGTTFMQMITNVIVSLAMGSTVIIARHIGEKKPEKAGDTIGSTVILFLIIGAVLTIVLELFTKEFTVLMNVPEQSVDKAISYIRICSAGTIVIIAYNVISSILRGVGNSTLPLIFVGISCTVNVIGDLILVGACGLDAAGAAIATVAAQLVSVIISLVVLRKLDIGVSFNKSQLKINKKELKSILNVGIPIALQEATVQVSFLVINSIVNDMGLMQSAGYSVAQKIVTFIMLIPSTIMQSVSAFVAQNMGAGRNDRAKKGFFTAIGSGCSLGIVIFCLGFFGGGLISSIFTDDSEVIKQSADFLRGFSVECILTCVLFSSIGYFNGRGKSIPVMIQGMTSAFGVRIPVSLIFSRLENTSLVLIGLATPITTVYGIIFFAICFALLRRKNRKSG